MSSMWLIAFFWTEATQVDQWSSKKTKTREIENKKEIQEKRLKNRVVHVKIFLLRISIYFHSINSTKVKMDKPQWNENSGNYLKITCPTFELENVTHPNKYHWRERNDEANSWLFQIPDVENEWSWNTSISLFFSLCSVLFAAIRESSHDLAF